MARMSTSEETSALIASLEAGRETGRLTIESADGRTCRAYVLMGKVFHAEGPAGEGASQHLQMRAHGLTCPCHSMKRPTFLKSRL